MAVVGEQPLIMQQAMQMQSHTLELEVHMHSLDIARRRGEWAIVHITLNQCLQVVKAKGSKIPTKWQV